MGRALLHDNDGQVQAVEAAQHRYLRIVLERPASCAVCRQNERVRHPYTVVEVR